MDGRGSGPVAVLRWGQGAQAPQILPRSPLNFFQGNLGLTFPRVTVFDVIGFIVISLSRCCPPNDEGPPIFFPRTAPVQGPGLHPVCSQRHGKMHEIFWKSDMRTVGLQFATPHDALPAGYMVHKTIVSPIIAMI